MPGFVHNQLRSQVTRRGLLRGTAGALLASGASGAILTGCGGGSQGQQAPSSGKDQVTFLNVLPLESLTYTPELVADTRGFFDQQGLKVDFQVTRGSAQAIQTILSGSAPLTRIGDIETMLAIADKGAPLINMGTLLKEVPQRFVSSRRAPITKPEDFRGKTIGTPSEGGTSETTLDLVLASAGIDPKTVPRQVVGLSPGVFNLVKEGRIGAYLVSLDTAIALQKQEPDAVVYSPGKAIASGGQLYAASKQGIESQRDLLQRYMRAIKQAVDSVIADQSLDETLRVMRTKYNFKTLQDPAVAKDSLREYVQLWTADGRENVLKTSPERWERAYREMARARVLKDGLNPREWFTNDLLSA
jgi:NitT/TauT family transport system substrate-binding protein